MIEPWIHYTKVKEARHKVTFCDSIYMKYLEVASPKKQIVARGWEEGGMGGNYLMGTEFYLVVIKVFWKSIEVVVVQHYECTKDHLIVLLKLANFMFCEFTSIFKISRIRLKKKR